MRRRRASMPARRLVATKLLVLGTFTVEEIQAESGLSKREIARLEEEEARVVRESVDACFARLGINTKRRKTP